jgi:hypothetical protein
MSVYNVMPDMETTHMENRDPDDRVAMYILEASKVEPSSAWIAT